MTVRERLSMWLLRRAIRRVYWNWSVCANRTMRRRTFGDVEVTVVFRDMTKPEGYSREELYHCLKTIRTHEAIQGWRVPEPDEEVGVACAERNPALTTEIR